MKKLTVQQTGQVSLRCGETFITSYNYYTMVSSQLGGCSISYAGSGTSLSYGIPCEPSPVSTSNGSYSSSGGSANDSYYTNYLAHYTISTLQRLCPQTFQFQTVQGQNNGPNGNTTRLEAGMRNDGVQFNSPIGNIPVGFNFSTFQLPLFCLLNLLKGF